MTTNVNKMNKLVLSFFEENAESSNVEELWMEPVVQKQVKALCASKSSNESRKKKDPNAPKRGKSAYLFFCSEHRNAVKTALGEEAKATDVTRELGVRWNLLKESTKASDKKALAGFEKEASADKDRYESEKSDYVPTEEDDEPKRRGGKKKAVKNGPKRAKSAYLYFCAFNRDSVKDSNPAFKATEVTSELGRMWNELKADEGRKSELAGFEAQALADKERYSSEKSELVDNVKEEPKPKGKPKGKVQPKSKTVVKAPKKPVKSETVPETEELLDEDVKVLPKSQNGYQLFSLEKRAELKESFPNATATAITKKLSVAWKALSKDEQKAWKTNATK